VAGLKRCVSSACVNEAPCAISVPGPADWAGEGSGALENVVLLDGRGSAGSPDVENQSVETGASSRFSESDENLAHVSPV